MNTISFWEAITGEKKQYPALNHNIQVDVAIIGGGITGVTTALKLIAAGKKVVIIESNRIGSGTTGFSTGNLYIPVQPNLQHIAAKFNVETAKNIAYSRKFAIDFIEATVKEKNINCHFTRRPWYFSTNDATKLPYLNKEAEIFKQIDIPLTEVNELPIPLNFKKAFMLENQARFNPLAYVTALAADLHDQGCKIFELTHITSIKENKDSCVLTTKGGNIVADNVVIATHTPIGFNLSQVYTAPYRSYVVGVELKDKKYPDVNFWDVGEPHHAISTHAISSSQPEMLFVAGSHHKTGQGKNMLAHYQELEKYLRAHFPVEKITYQWSAQHYQSADNIPYVGLASRFSKRTFIATGFFADGLTYGTLAGVIISDFILKNKNPSERTYNSNRFTPIASFPFLSKENMNVLWQYLRDYAWTPKEKKDKYDDIKAGEGKVVKHKGKKVAVCRDKDNKVHTVSAVCTHMKGIVHWNNAEETWDCPCHGSRFSKDGKVIEGPAIDNLEKIDDES